MGLSWVMIRVEDVGVDAGQRPLGWRLLGWSQLEALEVGMG